MHTISEWLGVELNFIYVNITDQMRKDAEAQTYSDGTRFRTELAREAILKAFPKAKPVVSEDGFDVQFGRHVFEVRAEGCNQPPAPNYSIHVSKKRKVDGYIFVFVHYNNDQAWIVGRTRRGRYFKTAKLREPGQKLRFPSGMVVNVRHKGWFSSIPKLKPFKQETINRIRGMQ